MTLPALGKHWIRYSIECALIFLSVLCAFLVDSYRETGREKEQELSTLRDITTDLIIDTTLLRSRIAFGEYLASDITNWISYFEGKGAAEQPDDYVFRYSIGVF